MRSRSFSSVTSNYNWDFCGSSIGFRLIIFSFSSPLFTNIASKSTSFSMRSMSYTLTAPLKAVSADCMVVMIACNTPHAGKPCSFCEWSAYGQLFLNTFRSWRHIFVSVMAPLGCYTAYPFMTRRDLFSSPQGHQMFSVLTGSFFVTNSLSFSSVTSNDNWAFGVHQFDQLFFWGSSIFIKLLGF